MPLTLEELKLITDARNFEKLVGEVENEFFDAKGRVYHFDAGDYAKRELAKDVTAFANAGGGYIFIGARTVVSTVAFGEEVKELLPLSSELIDPERYYKVVTEWVYPQPNGLRVEWHPFGADGKGLGVLIVPTQEERSKPFLITKTIEGADLEAAQQTFAVGFD